MLRALAARIADRLFEASQVSPRQPGEDLGEAARRTFRANLKLWREHGAVLRATLSARQDDPEIRRLWDELGSRFVNTAIEEIERERSAGRLPSESLSPTRLASVLVAMNRETFFETSLAKADPKRDEQILDALVTVWVRTLRGQVTPRPESA